MKFDEKMQKRLKIGITVVVIVLFVWLLIVYPLWSFISNENHLLDAAKEYFNINSEELPTGERVKTIKLGDLYDEKYLTEALKLPYTSKICDVDKSWVKVKNVDGVYKYYTHLKCGFISSLTDSKGPVINLNGKESVNVDLGDTYKELGVKSVVDNKDKKLKVEDVTVKGNVDTSKIGSYEVTYTIYDSLANKGEVTRVVNVVQNLNKTIELSKKSNNSMVDSYITLSGQLFKVVDLVGNDVLVVSVGDVSFINYSAKSEWLDYYYENLNEDSKKFVKEYEFCNDKVSSDNKTVTTCKDSTKAKVGFLSLVDYNKYSKTSVGLLPNTMSWTNSTSSKDKAWVIRDYMIGTNEVSLDYNKNENFGARPAMLIKGDSLILEGDGSSINPYYLGDLKVGKVNDKINTRVSGEYIEYSGYNWRIVDTTKDGNTKIVMTSEVMPKSNSQFVKKSDFSIYNPKQKDNIGYIVNNQMSDYLSLKLLTKDEVVVPIYKDKPSFSKEVETEKYNNMLAVPNIYELFSATNDNPSTLGYWTINSSQDKTQRNLVFPAGVLLFESDGEYTEVGFRLTAFIDEDVSILNGEGTKVDPYILTK